MTKYTVTGMSCAACQSRVEKAVLKVEGVTSCSVSLLTNSMGVEGDADSNAVIEAVKGAGYGACVFGSTGTEKDVSGSNTNGTDKINALENSLNENEIPALKKRLVMSVVFLLTLMYFSMGHSMWDFPVPAIFRNNPMAGGMLQQLLAIAVMLINRKFFVSGFKSLKNGAPNMDTLIALGSGSAFVWSSCVLFLMSDALVKGDNQRMQMLSMNFYFEAAAMILTLITVGKMLEEISKGKTTDALKSLLRLSPKTAVVEREGNEVKIPAAQVAIGDIFIVRPGESIPVDGSVVEGESAVDEAALTGESVPIDKAAGDRVFAATINRSGYLRCIAQKVGEDTVLSQIIQLVSDASATKAPIAKIADRVSGVFVPVVIAIAVVTIIVWLFAGADFGYALARGISVLVISCPCALGLATPVAIMVGNGVGAKEGILFKTSAALEEAGRVNIILLDKTGTITTGSPQVTDVYCCEGISERELLETAYALEMKSEHPLAKAVCEYCEDNNIAVVETEGFKALPGYGVEAHNGSVVLKGGSGAFIKKNFNNVDKVEAIAESFAGEGKTPLYFMREDVVLGIIAVADQLREDSVEAISQFKNMGLHCVLLTGDNERTARAVGEKAGVSQVIAGVLPDKKAETVKSFQKYGHVAMVGDGINDAPALMAADIGIAIGSGTDVAIDAAQIVLMKPTLIKAAAAIRLGRATLRNIHENLFWAFIYNIIGIPLAAGVYTRLLGISMNPMFGALAMSLSSFCVVSNALRLNFADIYNPKKYVRKNSFNNTNCSIENNVINNITDIENNNSMEEEKMTKTMIIEGMMCGHCEARVKKTLEGIQGVESAQVSHTEKTAVLTLSKEVADDVLKKAVEEQDYTVTEIK